MTFTDSNHFDSSRQNCCTTGVVFGKVQKGSVIYNLAWHLLKSRRSVRATLAAQILATGEAMDEILSLDDVLSDIIGVRI